MVNISLDGFFFYDRWDGIGRYCLPILSLGQGKIVLFQNRDILRSNNLTYNCIMVPRTTLMHAILNVPHWHETKNPHQYMYSCALRHVAFGALSWKYWTFHWTIFLLLLMKCQVEIHFAIILLQSYFTAYFTDFSSTFTAKTLKLCEIVSLLAMMVGSVHTFVCFGM